ncbi:Crp/Fnr family transcriptional regulator [Aureimonas leprariae]|uniref:Crp/Fnr family transcriptional regulator n=1 Tax=Plantimonas leprariae TaxID=2615207 RepID=A0A7V7PQJ5_9HYPH|nr:Crp/Fnr family transcriptional regulator [Aureimonas leprariae]KAB0680367.1 Crp/Fnr family transcriptional regulator [Aureimonas leprariae]
MQAIIDAFVRKLEAFIDLRPDELRVLQALQGPSVQIAAGKEIIHEGQHRSSAYILHEGWAYSCKRLPDGERQIIDIQIPGDFLGLHSSMLRMSDQTFVALTNLQITKINMDRSLEFVQSHPRLAAALLRCVAHDEAIIAEHLVSIGKRDALERTAHFLLEFGSRMGSIGRFSNDSYECPISQPILADALGITTTHLNRILRRLRERELVMFRNGTVIFLNRSKLVEATGFDRSYLEE